MEQARVFRVAVVISLWVALAPRTHFLQVFAVNPSLDVSAFTKVAHQHEAVLTSAFINQYEVAGFVLAFLIAITDAIAFHQLNFSIVVGQDTVI